MRTHRRATPLEEAIGRKCGLARPDLVPVMLLMRCRNCSSYQWVTAHESWPDATHTITFEHFDCRRPGKILRIRFMSRCGVELTP